MCEVGLEYAWARAAKTPQVTSPGNQNNALGDVVFLPIVATDTDGGTLSYAATGLPPGLSIDPGSGVIAGSVSTSASISTTGTRS